MRRLTAVAAVLFAGTLLASGLVRCEEPTVTPVKLTIAAGGVGGVYHAYANAFAKVIADELGADVRVRTTAASVENLRLVSDGRADLGFTLADAAALAIEGRAPFAERRPVAALARLYDNYTHLVVHADLAISSSEDLRGRRISTGAEGSGTDLLAERILTLAGLDPDRDITRRRLSLADSAQALRDGRIAGFFWSGGLPTAGISELVRDTPIRMLDLAEYVEPLRDHHGELFSEVSIPQFVYDLPDQVATVGVPNLLVVHREMDADLARTLTRLLFEHRDRLIAGHPEAKRLSRRVAVATHPMPLHPGAAAYYRAAKPLV